MTDVGEERRPAADGHGDRIGAAARGGALTGVGSVLNMVLSFAIVLIVTHGYGAEGAGVFFGVVALFTIAGTTAKLGAETGLVYRVSQALARRRDEDVVPTIRLAILPPLIVALLLGAAATAGASTLADWFTDAASADAYATVVRSVALLLPAYVAVHVLSGATRGLGRMRPTVYGISVGRPALQLVPMALVAGAGLGLGALGLAWAIPLAITAVAMYWWLQRLLQERGVPRVVPTPRPTLTRDFWSYAAPRGFANTLQIAQDRVGVLVVGAVAGAATTGVFVSVARLIGALHLFTHAVGQALNPQLSSLIAAGDRSGANRLLQQVSAWTALPVLPVCIVLVTFPEAVLSLFGAEFETGAAALSLLAATELALVVLAHTDNVLLMGGRSRTSLGNVCVSLLVTVLGMALLVPDHGLIGAAVGWSVGLAVYSLLPLWQGWRQLGLHPFGVEVANLGLAALPALAVAAGLRLALGVDLTAAALGGSAALSVFAAIVYRRRYQIGLPGLLAHLRGRHVSI